MNVETEKTMHTPLFALHSSLGGKMVPFAGYELPVQYPDGIKAEHLHTRTAAGLFDVSHMGQVLIRGKGAATALERLIPLDIMEMAVGQQSYSVMTNDQGGIRDDLIVCRWAEDEFFLVVNADCKQADLAYLRAELADQEVTELKDRALLALQGPQAADVLGTLAPVVYMLKFMTGSSARVAGFDAYVTRSGYTGEDGFELSVSAADAEPLARQLLADHRVSPIGLGARDSLRLEAGLCLYGHDMTASTTPVEAGLQWSIGRERRRDGERAGGYCGAEIIMEQMVQGAKCRRVGLRVEDRAPVREGALVINLQGDEIGKVTSGGFGPSVAAPVAMAMVAAEYAVSGTRLLALVRGKPRSVLVTQLPFVKRRYFRG